MLFVTSPRVRRQRGMTLIESLVALVVAALGVLGIAGVQLRTLADTQNSVRRQQAIRLIEDLDERLKVNPNSLFLSGDYVSDWKDSPQTSANCDTSLCDHKQLAAYDLANWKKRVTDTLPSGDANVFLAPGDNSSDRRQLGVMISWRENERFGINDADKKDIDATQVRAEDGTLSDAAGAAAACPAARICHLQYITLAARCAPYFPGGHANASAEFHCPGL
ncbi:MAG: type IV pilus modification protein PilV [Burkholderiaceae bacterium]|jgi:type IV pilus assembly protein PilV|nr:type IV pilus modification protein PilV [Burkholderiaceae bacterium]